jgi:DAK2 domain fusion protein YloV
VLERLDAPGIRRWADLGLAALGRHREEIDALNVFPVPDGDTGTNMYLTFEAASGALDEAGSSGADDPGASLSALARGALLGARGNSGIILSQIVRGFSEAFVGVEQAAGHAVAGVAGVAHVTDLAGAFRRAADSAYASVADPREGTVLSVARAAADAVAGLGPGTSLASQVTAAADAAAEALERTPDQLEILRRAGVVDAGGRGLVVILDALVEAVTGVRRDPGPSALPIPLDVHDLDTGGGAYEVMFLLDADEAAGAALRTRLAELGDSVVVVGGAGLWNVHVHCDDVGAAVEAGIEAGRPHRIRVTHLREEAAERRGADRSPTRGVVAVAHGPGTAGLLDASGATVVRGLPNVAPSTAEMLAGIERTGADEVVVLPSESDIRPVAEAAAEQARARGIRVAVLPTRSIVQTLAAVAVHDAGSPYDDDVVAMTQAAGATRYGGVSIASREAVTSAGRCQVGDVLGIVGGDIVEIGETIEEVAVAVLDRLLSTGGELVTLVRGDEADDEVAAAVSRRVRRRHHGVEVVVYDGGQPFWPLILGVE